MNTWRTFCAGVMPKRCNRSEVQSPGKLQELQEKVLEQARLTHEKLTQLNSEPLKALHTLKFGKFGYHPVKGSEMNLIEQLNQTFHDLASFAAARILFERFPECDGLRLNMETDSGRDIESIPPNKVWVEAEVFAAVSPKNNSKLKKEVKKLSESSDVAHRFVFFYSPSCESGRHKRWGPPNSKVEVWALSWDGIMQTGED